MLKADICGHCVRVDENQGRNGNVKCNYLGILRGYNEKACSAGWMMPTQKEPATPEYTATIKPLPRECDKYKKVNN